MHGIPFWFSTAASYFSDNQNPENDFGARLALLKTTSPEQAVPRRGSPIGSGVQPFPLGIAGMNSI
jgi:hypothetical protein